MAVSGLADEFRKYESMQWVIEENQESTLLLRATVRVSICIRVSAFKTSPVSLSIPARAHLSQTLNFQFDLPFHWKMESWMVSQLTVFRNGSAEPHLERYLNTWIPLPDDQNGGNKIMMRRCMGERERPLLMHPRLEALGLELWFYSSWVWRPDRNQRDRYLEAMPTTTHLGILCVVWQVSSTV